VFNFAPPGDGATTSRLAGALARAWGGGAVETGAALPFAEEEILRLDGRKAAGALGWRHRFDVDAAADWIVDWQRAVLSGTRAADATVGQVDRYLSLDTELRRVA
jgi:CDP-glucose 4,6-dehydratase